MERDNPGLERDGWVLKERLKVLGSEDHPYLETALGTIGGHEVAVHLSGALRARGGRMDFRVFMDGAEIFELGEASPSVAWFQVCRELGYDPEAHWDWDPALILFQQVIPALTKDWSELELPYTELGVPEGVICLATLREALSARASSLAAAHTEAERLAAETFVRLPLRAVVFHDDPERRVDFVGNPLDAPYMGVYLHLGPDREHEALISRVTLSSTGGMRWSPWLPGGEWTNSGREFAASMGARHFLRAAGLPDAPPPGFNEAFQKAFQRICADLEPLTETYREAWPAGIPWHRDPKNRFLNRMVVDVRLGEETVLVLDDGSEVVVAEHREAPLPEKVEIWGA